MSRIQMPPDQPSENDDPACLFGLSLSEAFRKVVLENAQVVLLGKSLIEQERDHAEVFSEGRYPTVGVEFGWPLDITAEELAYAFVGPFFIMIPGQPTRKPSPLMHQVSGALVERLRILRSWLMTGDLAAYGTYEKTGNFEPIHRLQWGRRVTIDVQSGDLRTEVGGKPVVQGSGVLLEAPWQRAEPPRFQAPSPPTAPQRVFHVKDMERDGIPSASTIPPNKARRSTPLQASIEEALRSLWPGGMPEALPLKVRDQQIIDWQKSHGLAIASSKTIRRHLAGRDERQR